MNALDNQQIDTKSFSWRNLLSIDRWEAFTVSASLTVVGTPTYVGRYRIIGAQCQFQATLVSTVSIATTAGTHYIALPIAAKGIAGIAVMTNDTTNVAVGVCHIDVTSSRCYAPAQAASGDTFTVCGSYEIGG